MTELRDGPGSQIPEIILNMTSIKEPYSSGMTMYAFTNHGRVLVHYGNEWEESGYTPKELPPKD